MSEETAYVSEKWRSLTEASRASSTKNRCRSVQQKYLAYLRKLGIPIDVVNESTPEVIVDFLSEATNDFHHKVSSTEMKIKAIRAYYNDREKNPLIGIWSAHKDPATGRTTSIQGNPASSERVRGLIRIHKKAQSRAGITEAKADPLRYEHLTAMFDAHIGIPPGNAKEDYSKIRRIKAWAMCVVGCNLLLRFNELVSLRMEMTEFHQEDLHTVYLHLPGGTKTQHERTLYIMEEWPNMHDPRASLLCALARWLRIRGGKDGYLFWGLEGNEMLTLGKKATKEPLGRASEQCSLMGGSLKRNTSRPTQ